MTVPTLTSVADDTAVSTPQPGELEKVFLESWRFFRERSPVFAYAANDFLRDAEGKQLILDYEAAVEEVARRNPGNRIYRSPMELRRALEDHSYQEGNWVVAPLIFLNGYNAYAQAVRPGCNIFDRLSLPAFANIRAEIQSHQQQNKVRIPNVSSMSLDQSSNGYHTLAARFLDQLKFNVFDEPIRKAGIIPVCFYEKPLAAQAG